jgi:hypothetical protein
VEAMTSPSNEGEILKANTPGAGQLDVDMPVVGVDGEPVGTIKEVREGDFLVSRPMARDVYVPYSFVLAMENPADRVRGGPTQPAQVILTIPGGHVDDQHWPHP